MRFSALYAAVPVAVLLFAVHARADFIVNNPSWEDDVVAPGASVPFASGWTIEGSAGTYHPLAVDYPGGIPDGVNVGFTAVGIMSQLLNRTLLEGVLYTLSVDVGRRVGNGQVGAGKLQLHAGGVLLALEAVPALGSGEFQTISVQFMAEKGHSQIGEQLEVVLEGRRGLIDWDNVTFIPTPGGLALLALAGLVGRRRRR